MLKIWFFQLALNMCEMRTNGVKVAFLSKKLPKIAQHLAAGGYAARLLFVICLSYATLLIAFPNLDVFYFCSSTLPLAKSWSRAKPGPSF